MKGYQEQYIQNLKEINSLSDFYKGTEGDFELWYSEKKANAKRISELRDQNNGLLNEGLFPALDDIHSLPSEELKELEDFAGVLLDWKTNLDPGVYVVIHDALLSFYRQKKNRDGIIKELYMLGMGLYYMRTFSDGIESEYRNRVAFRDEMIFSEAASYLRYFEEIKDTNTRSYIIRAMHNISLCVINDQKRRIAVNSRSMNVIKDDYYRQLAPELPWDRFLRASHQQMSINRQSISMENLTRDELTAVLDSCYEVFKAEEGNEQQSIRWLWPRYDMEFHCGYADLETTIKRLEQLIDGTEEGRYDESGLYANIELPLYYAQYMKNNPQMQTDGDKLRYLDKAYRKMIRTLLSVPAEDFKEYFFFQVRTVISNFYEIEGSYTYLDLVRNIIRRFSGSYYIRGRMTGDIMRALCEDLLAADGRFFDDIPFIAKTESMEKKKKAIMEFAGECGLFLDFGSIKMNFRKIEDSRNFFEDDMEIYMLHTLSGYEDLKRRKSTEEFADIALGHHRWYDGNGGYPDNYVRTDSEYRLMTDVAAAAVYIVSETKTRDLGDVLEEMTGSSQRRFSPIVLSCLTDEKLAKKIRTVLEGDAVYYKEIYDELHTDQQRR